MSEVYYRLDVRSDHTDRLNGQLEDWHSDVLSISNFKSDAQRVFRTKQATKLDDGEDFLFLFPTRKPLRFEHLGKEETVRPGKVFLLNAAEPYMVEVPDASENVAIKLSRESLEARLPHLDDLCGRTDIANPHLIPAVLTLGTQILSLRPEDFENDVEQILIDLVCLMLKAGQVRDEKATGSFTQSTLLFRRLCFSIDNNFSDHNLSPAIVATEHGISPRYLHKLFHAHNTSFGEYLLLVRLQQAHRMILDRTKSPLSIGEIAYQSGFSSQSHFSSCYKRHYNITPRQTIRLDGA